MLHTVFADIKIIPACTNNQIIHPDHQQNRKCITLFRISRSGLCSRIIRQDWKARRRTACLMTRCKTVSSSVVVVAFTSLPVFSSASMTATMSSRPLVATTCSGLCPSWRHQNNKPKSTFECVDVHRPFSLKSLKIFLSYIWKNTVIHIRLHSVPKGTNRDGKGCVYRKIE